VKVAVPKDVMDQALADYQEHVVKGT